MKDVIVETVFLVPEFDAFTATVVHRVRDMNEMFEELDGHTFVSGVLTSEFERDSKHVQAVHTHPAGAVGLFKVTAGGELSGRIRRCCRDQGTRLGKCSYLRRPCDSPTG